MCFRQRQRHDPCVPISLVLKSFSQNVWYYLCCRGIFCLFGWMLLFFFSRISWVMMRLSTYCKVIHPWPGAMRWLVLLSGTKGIALVQIIWSESLSWVGTVRKVHLQTCWCAKWHRISPRSNICKEVKVCIWGRMFLFFRVLTSWLNGIYEAESEHFIHKAGEIVGCEDASDFGKSQTVMVRQLQLLWGVPGFQTWSIMNQLTWSVMKTACARQRTKTQ